ncbi:MAG: DUF6054 family protein [Candidatus Thorarchaeota archaeon]|jgi:hypothetical protein
MRTIRVDGEFTREIIDFLSANYAKVIRKVWTSNGSTIAIFIHEEYVFRTSSAQTLTTIVETNGDFGSCEVTVVGSGGGKGLFNITWGSQSAGEDTIIKRIQNLTKRRTYQ